MPALGTFNEPRRPVVLPRFAAPSADLRRRQDDKDGSEHMINLMLTVLGLVFLALLLVSLLVLFRRRRLRRKQSQGLPTYNEVKQTANPRGLTIDTAHDGRSSILIIGCDGQPMLQNPNSPPHSPDNVPEIHITFPDEHDGHGHARNGRVLVVRVGDNATVGLEPVRDEEQLPAYEKEAKGEFEFIDMDQIGGLKEKDRTLFP